MGFDDAAGWMWRFAPRAWRRSIIRAAQLGVLLLLVATWFDVGPARQIAGVGVDWAQRAAVHRMERSLDSYEDRVAPALQQMLVDLLTPDDVKSTPVAPPPQPPTSAGG